MRLLPLLLIVPACAATGRDSEPSLELAGRTAGAPKDCVATSPTATLVARDTRTLVYRRGDTIWVNRLAADCHGLDPMSMLAIEVHGSQYCRGDRVRALEPGRSIPGPICILGAFTPWRR